MNRLRLLVIVLSMTTIIAYAQPTRQFDNSDPSAEEVYMLELINRARMDPAAEGVRLMDTDDSTVQAVYRRLGIDKEATRKAFATYPKRPPLAFTALLSVLARSQTSDMVNNGYIGHVNSRGENLEERYRHVLYKPSGSYGENVATYAGGAWYGHCRLNVDWSPTDQQPLSRRLNIMNFSGGSHNEIGIGIRHLKPEDQISDTVGPVVLTQNFGSSETTYLTGVAYQDLNHNGFYDMGEDMRGARITPDRGDYFVITTSSGGYTLPYAGTGSMVITASTQYSGTITTTVELPGTENVKVDFVFPSEPPPQVTLQLPLHRSMNVEQHGTSFVWNSAGPASTYTIQVATAEDFHLGSAIWSETTTDTTMMLALPSCQRSYFWRVKARNGVGTSPWSTVYALTTGGTVPSAPTLRSPASDVVVDHDAYLHFEWDMVPGASAHHFRISRNAGLTNPVVDDSAMHGTTFDAPAMPLSDQPFFWGVRAYDDTCGWGEWATRAMTPTVTSIDNDITSGPNGLAVVPNPVTPMSMLVMNVPAGGMATLHLVDANGSTIATRRLSLDGGRTTLPLSSLVDTDVAQGIYGIVLSCEAYVRYVNVAIIR
ncbi:MAG: hypothetical protein J0I17_07510 ['Candidatus Kapabacteria' thiocyanatum]|uniref:Fibronectin type-III domain-containing protein n=1 Tax=Candidatus Kapaibacterium thiocyanatum TaxID=1895771 RepID=A0A1M3L2C3_9BACT|nr:hypothetical protein ['Candidatus Kapabacteria' thiocyanatum]OJX59374.1 MAG: hypothetical protein BGO89_02870 ['Candidatus Kapabacteria' thiocyanatum]